MLSAEFSGTAPQPLRQMMQDMHDHTWFTLSQHDATYRTFRGSRPGSPLADLAYNSMMRIVLSRLHERLGHLHSLHAAKSIVGIDCPPIAWVDDVAVPFVARTVNELDMTALAILDCTTQTFAEFGLMLNQDHGKTEAVLQYRGTGSGAKIEETFIDNLGHLANQDNTTRLRIVTDYSYLGTMYSQSALVDREIHTRVGKAQFVFRQLKRTIFCNRRLPVSTRVTLLNSLVVSIVLHGAGNWHLLSTKQFNHVAHILTGWHRSIVGKGFWSEDNVDDTELLASVGALPLAVRLAKMRLLYAFQWIQHAPQVAVDCVTAEDRDGKSWLAAVRHAIRWFHTMHPQEEPVPETTEATIAWIATNRAHGAAQVRRAAKRFGEQQRMMSQVIQGHRRIHQWGVQQGILEAAKSAPVELPGEHSCDLCSRKFHSAQALQGHRWKWHSQISEERRYIYDDTCRICNKCFWTPQRLQQHLKYSKKFPQGCFEQLRQYMSRWMLLCSSANLLHWPMSTDCQSAMWRGRHIDPHCRYGSRGSSHDWRSCAYMDRPTDMYGVLIPVANTRSTRHYRMQRAIGQPIMRSKTRIHLCRYGMTHCRGVSLPPRMKVLQRYYSGDVTTCMTTSKRRSRMILIVYW